MLFLARLPACSKPQEISANTNPNVNTATAASSNFPSASSATQTPTTPARSRVVFILDASGSMQERVGQEEKMVVARRVLKESIAKLPDEGDVGLIAYGHRKKNDCADIEVLSQLKSIDKPALQAQIDALRPGGRTNS